MNSVANVEGPVSISRAEFNTLVLESILLFGFVAGFIAGWMPRHVGLPLRWPLPIWQGLSIGIGDLALYPCLNAHGRSRGRAIGFRRYVVAIAVPMAVLVALFSWFFPY